MTVNDMIARFDARMLARLSFDDDLKHTVDELQSSTILRAALDDAYGEFLAAVNVAGMYDANDLERLAPESRALANRVVCELALSFLYNRRGGESRDSAERLRAAAEEYLDRLRKGERLFSLVQSNVKEKTGRPELVEPTRVQLEGQNGITQRARVYFGGVGDRLRRKKFNG